MDVNKYRLVVSLLVLAIWLVINVVTMSFVADASVSPVALLGQSVQPTFVISVLFLFAATWLFGWNDVGLNAQFSARSLLVAWVPLLAIALAMAAAFALGLPPGRTTAFILVNTFLVGVSEELMFRGILFQGLRSRLKIWPSILLTSLCFGAVHILNVRWMGSIWLPVAQACAAFCTGTLLMAIRIRTRSLDPAIILHAAWDCSLLLLVASAQSKVPGALDPGSAAISDATPSLLAVGGFALVTLAYAIFLLRNVNRADQSAS